MATDTRLWLYGQLKEIQLSLRQLIVAAADRAEAEVDVLMPGFTHLQVNCSCRSNASNDSGCAGHLALSWPLAPPCLAAAAVNSLPGAAVSPLPQPAQTVRWSHWLLSHAAAWQRDDQRLTDLLPRVARLPLGSGALAGNPFGVDRRFLAAGQRGPVFAQPFLGAPLAVLRSEHLPIHKRNHVLPVQSWAWWAECAPTPWMLCQTATLWPRRSSLPGVW